MGSASLRHRDPRRGGCERYAHCIRIQLHQYGLRSVLRGPAVRGTPLTESFTTGLGSWVQGLADQFDWTRTNAATPSAGTGPASDHTTGTGHYLYTEANSPNSPTRTAELYGPCIDLSGYATAELSFWYHMEGTQMGTLHVHLWNGTTWTQSAWSRTAPAGHHVAARHAPAERLRRWHAARPLPGRYRCRSPQRYGHRRHP